MCELVRTCHPVTRLAALVFILKVVLVAVTPPPGEVEALPVQGVVVPVGQIGPARPSEGGLGTPGCWRGGVST